VDELILGLDWLETRNCVWDFGKNFTVEGQSCKLFAHQPTLKVRHIVLHENAVVPARSECISEANIYADLTARSCQWASAPLQVMPEVFLARSIVDDQPQSVHVRVINVADDDATIEKGTHFGYLEEVAVVSDEAANHDEPQNDMEHLISAFNTVDEIILETDREKLWQLLQGFSKVFSTDEHDLKRATTMQHTIDTGLSNPVRQALRRHPVHQAAAAMIEQGIIRSSRSEWSSNLVLFKIKMDRCAAVLTIASKMRERLKIPIPCHALTIAQIHLLELPIFQHLAYDVDIIRLAYILVMRSRRHLSLKRKRTNSLSCHLVYAMPLPPFND
jgi:hypothetical protein